jgi:hypothetical protein
LLHYKIGKSKNIRIGLGMEANYNESNFFARIFDCKMVIWEEKSPSNLRHVGAEVTCWSKAKIPEGETPGLYHPSTGLWERKALQLRGMWALRPPTFIIPRRGSGKEKPQHREACGR